MRTVDEIAKHEVMALFRKIARQRKPSLQPETVDMIARDAWSAACWGDDLDDGIQEVRRLCRVFSGGPVQEG